MPSRRRAWVITLCHFASALGPLGIPPFLSILLRKSFHVDALPLTGLFYVLPTILSAISAPVWGWIADRTNPKLLLIRAHLGLALSFLLAGVAPNVWLFATALALQGVLGGTFAASRAYLASLDADGDAKALSAGLTLMEASPRAGLVIAPSLMAFVATLDSPVAVYRWIAALPLMAAAIVLAMPNPSSQTARRTAPSDRPRVTASSGEGGVFTVLSIYFSLGFSSVLVSPFLVAIVASRFPNLGGQWLGFFFGAPHIAYLLLARPFERASWMDRPEEVAIGSLALLGASFWAQGSAHDPGVFLLARVLGGVAQAACLVALHRRIGANLQFRRKSAGLGLGLIDACTKLSTVAAGCLASFLVALGGMNGLFYWSAVAILPALGLVIIGVSRQANKVGSLARRPA